MFVDISLRFIERDFRVDFLKLAPSRDFETSSRAVKQLQGATLRPANFTEIGYCLTFPKSRDNDRAHSNSRWRRLQTNM